VSLTQIPTAWEIIPPDENQTDTPPQVIISTQQTILILDSSQCQNLGPDFAPLDKISLSPDGKLLALFSKTGTLR